MIVTVEKGVYEKLREEAEKRGVSVPAVLRQLLINYFNLEDDTKTYRKEMVKNVIMKVGDKEYVRLQVQMKRENELFIKNELKKRKMSVNQLLKNEILLIT